MAAPAAFPNVKVLTLDQARAAIREAVGAFNVPENLQKMNDAKAQAGGDIFKMMQIVMPVAISIAKDIIVKHGFEATQPGVMQFIMAIQMHAADPEIADLSTKLKQQFLPPGFQPPPMFAQPPK